MKRKVILDVDTGSDDAVAIITAMKSKDIDLLGITVVAGSLSLENTVDNTLRVVDFLNGDVPVCKGCDRSLIKTLSHERGYAGKPKAISSKVGGEEVAMHPKTLPLPEAVSKVQRINAVSWIVDTLLNSEEKITLIGVGPLTNIAIALTIEPKIIRKIEEIVVMGGGVNKGNITKAAEFNFYVDPEAAKIVIDSGCKVRIVTINATESISVDREDGYKFGEINEIGKFIEDMIITRIEANEKLSLSNAGTTSLHGVLAVFSLIDESILLDEKKTACDVHIRGGIADGALIVDTRDIGHLNNVYISTKADKNKFIKMLTEIISS